MISGIDSVCIFMQDARIFMHQGLAMLRSAVDDTSAPARRSMLAKMRRSPLQDWPR